MSSAKSFTNVATTDSNGCDDCSSEIAVAPTAGATVCNAATTYDQNTVGSLSCSSSDSHAVERRPPSESPNHSLSSVVLPNPAGADTSVSAG